MVPFIGLTGGIGAGKSTALEALEQLGAAVLSTDAVVHGLYDDPEVSAAVRERFGSSVADSGGGLDRRAIAGRAFATSEDREWLEHLLWPRVGEAVATWRAQTEEREPPARAAVVEVPLLFESGMDQIFDATIAILADENTRARRAAERGHSALAERAQRQLPQEEKAARATYVVCNDGTIGELKVALSEVLERLPPVSAN